MAPFLVRLLHHFHHDPARLQQSDLDCRIHFQPECVLLLVPSSLLGTLVAHTQLFTVLQNLALHQLQLIDQDPFSTQERLHDLADLVHRLLLRRHHRVLTYLIQRIAVVRAIHLNWQSVSTI